MWIGRTFNCCCQLVDYQFDLFSIGAAVQTVRVHFIMHFIAINILISDSVNSELLVLRPINVNESVP